MKLYNKFIIIVPVYNAKNLIVDCLSSIFTQSFEDLGVIIRDDCSTDGTDIEIKKFLGVDGDEVISKFNNKDFIFIKNQKKLYPVGNTYESVINFVDNQESIIGVVDGDDKLYVRTAVSKINKVYENENKWMVWSQHQNSSGGIGSSKPLPENDIIYSSRNYWSVTHFRTSKCFLFHKLNKEDLMDPFDKDTYFKFCGDASFLYPFCEMCGNEKSFFLNEILYYYNNTLPTNEHNKNFNMAVKYGLHVKSNGKKYTKLFIS
jgi:glycosyltransferase involved in cell wall biosynthesis